MALRSGKRKNVGKYWLEVVTLTFASWNQIVNWLRRVDAFRLRSERQIPPGRGIPNLTQIGPSFIGPVTSTRTATWSINRIGAQLWPSAAIIELC
jgi:hypothetical protein